MTDLLGASIAMDIFNIQKPQLMSDRIRNYRFPLKNDSLEHRTLQRAWHGQKNSLRPNPTQLRQKLTVKASTNR